VVEPLRRLDEQALALGHGDLAARASVVGGPPEVVSLAATFNEMAAQLDALVTAQRRFVSDASHQLRTPLTALRLRLENLDPTEPTAMATTQGAALDEVARLTRLVDGLLSLARAENHRPELELLDVAAVTAERHAAWAPLAAERGVELRAPDPAPVLAAAVPGHVEQILDNLIDNALEATTAGGHVVLRVAPAAGGIEVHVVDDGPGLSDDERSHAFDAFWTRANGASSKGAGLGLAIAAQLARTSGGSLRLDRSATGGIDAVARFHRTVRATTIDAGPARRNSPQSLRPVAPGRETPEAG
jgi:signal transduction histidine kinase